MAAIAESSSVPDPLNPDEICLDEKESSATITIETVGNKGKRIPKRVLHFSDGILEEFSSSDDEDQVDGDVNRNVLSQALVDTSTLTWGPYLWYKMARAGSKTLAACDFLGENLASFFGITSPKYQFEVDDYFRKKAEEEKQQQQHDIDLKNWTTSETAVAAGTIGGQPTSSSDWKRVDV